MACRINIDNMPELQRFLFLQVLAKEINRIRDDPALWAKIQAIADKQTEEDKPCQRTF